MKTLILCMAITLCLVSNALTRDLQNRVFLSGLGNHSCGQMTEDVKKILDADSLYEEYIDGFLNAVNLYAIGKMNFFEGTDSTSRYKFVLKYCEENPLDRVLCGLSHVRSNHTRRFGEEDLFLTRSEDRHKKVALWRVRRGGGRGDTRGSGERVSPAPETPVPLEGDAPGLLWTPQPPHTPHDPAGRCGSPVLAVDEPETQAASTSHVTCADSRRRHVHQQRIASSRMRQTWHQPWRRSGTVASWGSIPRRRASIR